MKSYVVSLRIVCLLLDLRKEKKENYVPRDLLQIFEYICHLHSRVRPKFSPSYRLDSERKLPQSYTNGLHTQILLDPNNQNTGFYQVKHS